MDKELDSWWFNAHEVGFFHIWKSLNSVVGDFVMQGVAKLKTYYRSFMSLTKTKSISKLFVPLNILVNTCIFISVLVKQGHLLFIYL